MKTYKSLLLTLCLCVFAPAQRMAAKGEIKQVPFTNVHINDEFWKQRLDVMSGTTIRYAFQKCSAAGQIRNFEYAGRIVSGKAKVGDLAFQSGQPYDDAEVYKVLEGAAYVLHTNPDAYLESYCDGVIDKIVSAQEPDGYLQTNFTIHNPLHPWYEGEKWKMDWNLSHETFNVAELIESAIAYYQATGKDKLLKCAIKAADNMISVFNEDGIKMAPGHAVVEMALVRLYELTGDAKYLNACKFFLDCRGIRKFDPTSLDLRVNGKYWQDHLPAIEQRSAEGHAVRAMYFYSGMADWVRYTGDKDYETAVTAIWDNIANKKFYITGGFGARDNNEAFGEDYELPNATAYCETCASVAGSMFNLRMFRLNGEGRYIDMLERALYNTVLDGYSITGKSFYYPNRLESSSRGDKRSEWFGTSCCPTNLCRLIPSVPGYVYAVDDDDLYWNLFVNSTATASTQTASIDMAVETAYPYAGKARMTLSNVEYHDAVTSFAVRVRIPGWTSPRPVDGDLYTYINPSADAVKINVNGQAVEYSVEKGYAVLNREWKNGDYIDVVMPMDVYQVVSNENLKSNDGLVAYERGPLVYCAEDVDNDGSLSQMYIPENTSFTTSTALGSLFNGGMPMIKAKGMKTVFEDGETKHVETIVNMIPYFARAYREGCTMKVWIPKDATKMEKPVDYIDEVVTCDEASESAHNLTGEKMRTGNDLGWRDSEGGYIQYTLKVDPDRPNDLIIKQWGSDGGNRRYDVYVNGSRVSYDELNGFALNQYYYMHHQLPFEYTKGRDKVTVRLQSVDGSIVGGLYGVYTAVSEATPEATVPVDYMWTNSGNSRNQHHYKSNGGIGSFRNRTWLDGQGEAGQTWTMKVNATNRNYLMLLYWGSEGDMRNFDIFCDNTFVGSESLQNNNPGRFFFRCYPIPEEGTSGKSEVTIHLSSPQGTKTGGIYYAYMMSAPVESGIKDVAVEGKDAVYTIAGVPASDDTRGVVVKKGRKFLK